MIIAIIFIVVTSISGFFGKGALEKTGGSMIVLGIGFALASSSFSWLWVVAWLIGLFIGWAIVVIREVIQEGAGNLTEPYLFTSEIDNFTISFPNKPELTQHQGGVRMHRYGANGLGYLIIVSGYDITTVKNHDDLLKILRNSEKFKEVQRAELQKSLDIMPEMVDKFISSQNKDTFHGYPCAYMEYINSGLHTYTLKFLVSDRKYDITVAHHKKEVAEPEFHRFVESFRFANS